MKKWLAAGVAGLFALTATVAGAATTSCSTVAACLFGSNTSSGVGVEGSSKSGFGISGVSSSGHGVNGDSTSSFGVVGTTKAVGSTSGNARAGVLGEDLGGSESYNNSGVSGTSTVGYGVYGKSSAGVGVYGTAGGTATGVEGVSTSGLGVYGGAFDGVGGAFSSVKGDGVTATTSSGTAVDAIATGYGETPGYIFKGSTSSAPGAADVVSIDSKGNEFLAGTIAASALVSNKSNVVSTKRSDGEAVASYGARSSSPTLEDFGKSTLRSGSAYVAIESVFASTIDSTAGYMVFITPEGDSRGLYTTQLTSHGFSVRENGGGRSSLTFDYRILAHPADSTKARLPMMAPVRRLVANRKTS